MKWLVRILGVIIGIIFLATGALAIMSSRPNAGRMHNAVTIHKPAEAIWPWLYEPEKLKSWVTWLKEVRPDTPPQVGVKGVWVMADANNNNKPMEIYDVYESVRPNREFTVTLTAAEGFKGRATYRLTPTDGGTLLECDEQVTFDSALIRLMTPLVMREAEKKMDSDFARLRTLIEATR
jgi:uncharacterized protein YndB with AHSA1/START domain